MIHISLTSKPIIMKNSRLSKKWLLWILPLAVAFSSCYYLTNLEFSREEVEPGGEFTMKADFLPTGAEIIKSYGCLGACIPEGWEVKDVVYHYQGHGKDVHMGFVPSTIYTDIMNHRYSYVRENQPGNWRWVGFVTPEKVDMCMHWNSEESGGVSYAWVTATIVARNVEGDYTIEFLMGDEEDGLEQYKDNMDHDPLNPSRLFNTGTFAADPSKENQRGKQGSTVPSIVHPAKSMYNANTIKVTKNAGITTAEADAEGFRVEGGQGCILVTLPDADGNGVASVYDAAGRLADSQGIDGGAAQLNAPKGICIVEVSTEGRKLTKKVFVR